MLEAISINDLVGLISLICLEIILGIDNLIFIALLVNRLPHCLRNKARVIGLSFALILRIALLFSLSWIISLTSPLFTILGHAFSGRDIILIIGGLFLLFKALHELQSRINAINPIKAPIEQRSSFAIIVIQIIVIDAVFSIDSVITAVGMVESLAVMVTAVVISMTLMILVSKSLTEFINKYPSIIILCLGFLLMIGFALIIDGLGVHIPKAYIYFAMGFSVLIELLNQVSLLQKTKKLSVKGELRNKVVQSIIYLLGGKNPIANEEIEATVIAASNSKIFHEEKPLISNILSLANISALEIMHDISKLVTISITDNEDIIKTKLAQFITAQAIITQDKTGKIMGIIEHKAVLNAVLNGQNIYSALPRITKPLIIVSQNKNLLEVLNILNQNSTNIVLVKDNHNRFIAFITLNDILQIILRKV